VVRGANVKIHVLQSMMLCMVSITKKHDILGVVMVGVKIRVDTMSTVGIETLDEIERLVWEFV